MDKEGRGVLGGTEKQIMPAWLTYSNREFLANSHFTIYTEIRGEHFMDTKDIILELRTKKGMSH